jgi:hypothetical protein
MDSRAAIELKTLLAGVALPAEKPRLLEHAVRQRAEPQLLAALQSLPDRQYESLDEVVEELLQMQPNRPGSPPPDPQAESGGPPGGSAYTGRRSRTREPGNTT